MTDGAARTRAPAARPRSDRAARPGRAGSAGAPCRGPRGRTRAYVAGPNVVRRAPAPALVVVDEAEQSASWSRSGSRYPVVEVGPAVQHQGRGPGADLTRIERRLANLDAAFSRHAHPVALLCPDRAGPWRHERRHYRDASEDSPHPHGGDASPAAGPPQGLSIGAANAPGVCRAAPESWRPRARLLVAPESHGLCCSSARDGAAAWLPGATLRLRLSQQPSGRAAGADPSPGARVPARHRAQSRTRPGLWTDRRPRGAPRRDCADAALAARPACLRR